MQPRVWHWPRMGRAFSRRIWLIGAGLATTGLIVVIAVMVVLLVRERAYSAKLEQQLELRRAQPMLTSAQAYGVVKSRILASPSRQDGLLGLFRCLVAPEGRRSLKMVDHLDGGTWVITTESGCVFLVDDRTGKVTGP